MVTHFTWHERETLLTLNQHCIFTVRVVYANEKCSLSNINSFVGKPAFELNNYDCRVEIFKFNYWQSYSSSNFEDFELEKTDKDGLYTKAIVLKKEEVIHRGSSVFCNHNVIGYVAKGMPHVVFSQSFKNL